MRFFIFLFVISIGLYSPCEAQILKKLKERVSNSAEESVSRRIEKKANEKVEDGLDGILESDQKQPNKKKKREANPYGDQPAITASTSRKTPADTYQFDYKLAVEMEMDGENMDMNMDYLLSSNGKYYAMEMNEGVKMLMVTDVQLKAMFQFMDMGAAKMMMVQDLDIELDEEQSSMENTKIQKIPGKKILGFDCEGIEMVNEDMRSKIYFTKKAPISFTFFNDPQQAKSFTIPKEIEDLMNQDILMLEMQMQDFKEGFDVIWKAKSLEKHEHHIKTSDYRKI